MVNVNNLYFIIAVPTQVISIDGIDIIGISVESPLYEVLAGLRVEETFGRQAEIANGFSQLGFCRRPAHAEWIEWGTGKFSRIPLRLCGGLFHFRTSCHPYAASAAEAPVGECAGCHMANVAKTDMTWVPFYPLLRDK